MEKPKGSIARIITTAMLSIAFTITLMPPKAEAAIGLVGITLIATGVSDSVGGAIAGVGILGGMLMYTSGAVVALCLDADSVSALPLLEKDLADRYPFIDNPDLIARLALIIQSKVSSQLGHFDFKNADSMVVSFSESEVFATLSAGDLTPEQIQMIVNDLK